MRLAKMRSITLHKHEVREIGRYDDGSSVGLSGFRKGMMMDCFHCGGDVGVIQEGVEEVLEVGFVFF